MAPTLSRLTQPALKDKALPRLGEGWEEEAQRPKQPHPHSNANELQPG